MSRWRTADGTGLRLRYAHADYWAEFLIDEHGRRVWAARSQNVVPDDVVELLLGQVFSCVLAQRRLTFLHSAVVEIESRVLALVGAAGAGKSTTALALLQRGAALLSDDVAVLRKRRGRFSVSVGAPRVRLRLDAAETLVGSHMMLEPVWGHRLDIPEKRYVQAERSNGAGGAERTLDAVCLLGPAKAAGIEPRLHPLTPAQALPRLMANRHMVDVLDRESHARDFKRLARLAETVPVLELMRPVGLGSIHQTAAMIEADLTAIA